MFPLDSRWVVSGANATAVSTRVPFFQQAHVRILHIFCEPSHVVRRLLFGHIVSRALFFNTYLIKSTARAHSQLLPPPAPVQPLHLPTNTCMGRVSKAARAAAVRVGARKVAAQNSGRAAHRRQQQSAITNTCMDAQTYQTNAQLAVDGPTQGKITKTPKPTHTRPPTDSYVPTVNYFETTFSLAPPPAASLENTNLSTSETKHLRGFNPPVHTAIEVRT